MRHVDVLRDLVSMGGGAAVPPGASKFRPNELRFVLEYGQRPDLDAARGRITDLGLEGFVLEPLGTSPALEPFLVLRFPGVDRTLDSRHLFAIGYELADALSLRSAEPDLGAKIYADPEPLGDEGVESAIANAWCRSKVPAPNDRQWHLTAMRVPEVWLTTQGEGVLIAQPDTGVAAHVELEAGMIDPARAKNIFDGSTNPEDPLDPGTANPGHGTSTASVLASRTAGTVAGTAPRATLVPIRCIEDVKVFDAAPVAAAIEHAVAVGCHVISMSLGGTPSRALHAAVRAAIEADVLVLAAAGNCVRYAVWPARYAEVICVAGTDIQDRRWKGSCHGAPVDISAPGESVWRAEPTGQTAPYTSISPGQGTSYAVAATAGVAALWLANRRPAAIVEARRRGVPLQTLFRTALRATARVPAEWDADEMGAGIVDATELLALELADIPAGAVEHASATDASVRDLVIEASGEGSIDLDFDWSRYGAEIAHIALEQARLGGRPLDSAVESKSNDTRPSPQLQDAVERGNDPRLKPLAEHPYRTSVTRPRAVPRLSEDETHLLINAVPRVGTALESIGQVTEEGARSLMRERMDMQLERFGKLLELRTSEPNPSVDSRIRKIAEVAMRDVVAGNTWTPTTRAALETLVRLTGRPALRVTNGTIDPADPEASEWQVMLEMAKMNELDRRIASIGRIDIGGIHAGTGFVVGDGLVMTNRHVLQLFAAPVPRRNNPVRWVKIEDDVVIDFAEAPNHQNKDSRFQITDVIGAGDDDIDGAVIDLAELDVALLRVKAENRQSPLPSPTPVVKDPMQAAKGKNVLVIGYPARPVHLPGDEFGKIDMEIARRLNQIYRNAYGRKYVSPGSISDRVGTLRGDAESRVIGHDATTLSGNSGSCVIGFDDPMGAVGLHFGGVWRGRNYAHALSALHGTPTVVGVNSDLEWWP